MNYIKRKRKYIQFIFQDIIQPVKKIVLLTIPNEKCWYYLTVTILSALIGITSKHHSDFYCSYCLLSFSTKNKLKSNEKVCKNKDFWGIVLSNQKIIH